MLLRLFEKVPLGAAGGGGLLQTIRVSAAQFGQRLLCTLPWLRVVSMHSGELAF